MAIWERGQYLGQLSKWATTVVRGPSPATPANTVVTYLPDVGGTSKKVNES